METSTNYIILIYYSLSTTWPCPKDDHCRQIPLYIFNLWRVATSQLVPNIYSLQVYESSPDDFSRLTGGSGGGGGGSGGGGEGGSGSGSGDSNVCVVRMQGLPYRVEETEIVS